MGGAVQEGEFRVAGLEVEVFKWNAEGVNLYATVGASARPMAGRDPNHRVEFFAGLLPAKDEVPSPLAALALYPTREGVALDHGHTVPADGPLWPGTDMGLFLVLRPIGDIIPPLELPGGLHVDFLQAIPIFESELAYKTEHGAEALLLRWEASRVPFWDPNRSPSEGETPHCR
jgi:hypothetical protein